nr:MAG TPA: hypothetical protein [Caudoviricetes sp.]
MTAFGSSKKCLFMRLFSFRLTRNRPAVVRLACCDLILTVDGYEVKPIFDDL